MASTMGSSSSPKRPKPSASRSSTITTMELMASYPTTASMRVPRQTTIPHGITPMSMAMAAITKPFTAPPSPPAPPAGGPP